MKVYVSYYPDILINQKYYHLKISKILKRKIIKIILSNKPKEILRTNYKIPNQSMKKVKKINRFKLILIKIRVWLMLQTISKIKSKRTLITANKIIIKI